MSLFSLLISSVLQVSFVLILSYVAYRFIGRQHTRESKVSFWKFIGFIYPTKDCVYIALKIALVLGSMTILIKLSGVLLTFSDHLRFESSVVSPIAVIKDTGFGLYSVFYSIVYSVVQTGFSEEILFRGVVAKRFIAKFGYVNGNTLQACAFGAIHLILLAKLHIGMSLELAFLFFIMPFTLGYLMGYMNEKKGNGSIVPSWIIHSATNLFVALASL